MSGKNSKTEHRDDATMQLAETIRGLGHHPELDMSPHQRQELEHLCAQQRAAALGQMDPEQRREFNHMDEQQQAQVLEQAGRPPILGIIEAEGSDSD